MKNIGLDQTTAWILAVLIAGCIYGGGYFVSKFSSRHSMAAKDSVVTEPSSVHESANDEQVEYDHPVEKDHHKQLPPESPQAHKAEQLKPENYHEENNPHDQKKVDELDSHLPAVEKSHEPEKPAHQDPDEFDQNHLQPSPSEPSEHQDQTKASPSEDHSLILKKKDNMWSYHGSQGPNYWGDLKKEFVACSAGKAQSPINIQSALDSRDLKPLKFVYHPTLVGWHHVDYAVKGTMDPGSYVLVDGKRFELDHFVFHVPSEHKIDGVSFDVELQIVHKDPYGNMTIVAVLFEEGKKNPNLEPLWQDLPLKANRSYPVRSFDLNKLLPPNHAYYYYSGSQTIPPCAEGANWFVLTQMQQLSGKQIDKLINTIKFNARPVQPLYSRRALKSRRFALSNAH